MEVIITVNAASLAAYAFATVMRLQKEKTVVGVMDLFGFQTPVAFRPVARLWRDVRDGVVLFALIANLLLLF